MRGLDSIEIEDDFLFDNLKYLSLSGNNINADGCRQLAKLLRHEQSSLETISVGNNMIDDEGVAYLVDSLRNNTVLKHLHLDANKDISAKGEKLLLKLVNDVSSIKATLRSNHTLQSLSVPNDDLFQALFDGALKINKKNMTNPAAAGRERKLFMLS